MMKQGLMISYNGYNGKIKRVQWRTHLNLIISKMNTRRNSLTNTIQNISFSMY